MVRDFGRTYTVDSDDVIVAEYGEITVYNDPNVAGIDVLTIQVAEGFCHLTKCEAIEASRAILKHFNVVVE